jgi:hypothetical protein
MIAPDARKLAAEARALGQIPFADALDAAASEADGQNAGWVCLKPNLCIFAWKVVLSPNTGGLRLGDRTPGDRYFLSRERNDRRVAPARMCVLSRWSPAYYLPRRPRNGNNSAAACEGLFQSAEFRIESHKGIMPGSCKIGEGK